MFSDLKLFSSFVLCFLLNKINNILHNGVGVIKKKKKKGLVKYTNCIVMNMAIPEFKLIFYSGILILYE